jgi:hypothetical protein
MGYASSLEDISLRYSESAPWPADLGSARVPIVTGHVPDSTSRIAASDTTTEISPAVTRAFNGLNRAYEDIVEEFARQRNHVHWPEWSKRIAEIEKRIAEFDQRTLFAEKNELGITHAADSHAIGAVVDRIRWLNRRFNKLISPVKWHLNQIETLKRASPKPVVLTNEQNALEQNALGLINDWRVHLSITDDFVNRAEQLQLKVDDAYVVRVLDSPTLVVPDKDAID